MLMWIDKGYFEQLFWMKPNFNIKFGKKTILPKTPHSKQGVKPHRTCFVSLTIIREWKHKAILTRQKLKSRLSQTHLVWK